MVTIIKTGYSIRRILYYNENKVSAGVARCITAENFPLDADDMTVTMKLNLFERHLQLNENVTRNSVHISLNFHNSETSLSEVRLLEIASEYMKQIGFGDQPYLVYQHHDAGHPHLHIVSIKVRADSQRIDMNNIGRDQSEKARKLIEEKYHLVKAEQQAKEQSNQIPERVSASKVQYGKTETKRAIQNVLEVVLEKYNYTSLAELNAVLRGYNVLAERGSEDSRVFQTNGLLYRILDENGTPVGVPIKASLFYSQPTLKNLNEKFQQNQTVGATHKTRIRNAIDLSLSSKPASFGNLVSKLQNMGILALPRLNDQGYMYGITYVDYKTKSVFNGSRLGKNYSAKGILDRCDQDNTGLNGRIAPARKLKADNGSRESATEHHQVPAVDGMLDALLAVEYSPDNKPYRPRKKRKKKSKK